MLARTLAVFYALVAVSSAWGQTQAATARGRVEDSSAAVIAGARVTLTNVDQGRSWNYTTNAVGEYVFVQIPPGNYALSAEASGFKKYQREGLILQVAQVADLTISLEIGTISETVEVVAPAPLLETASSTLGEVVNSLTTEALPLNGRNVMQLVALTPGINAARLFRSETNGSGSYPAASFSANGGRNFSNAVLLDGSPQEIMANNNSAYIPSPDAVQEFKVQTNNLPAEYGQTGGAVINIVQRSGTQQFHGVLYEFFRNDRLDANDFFSNRNSQNKAALRYNQFGFTLGGPLTPSRNSTFFFVNYEGVRQVNPGSTFLTVPTAKMRTGDFSEISAIIYDPRTIDASGRRQPFSNNRIPADRLNPIALKVLDFYPLPNQPGVVNNFFSQAGRRTTSNNVSIKIDRRLSDRQNLFGRFSWLNGETILPDDFGNPASPNAGINGTRSRSATLDDTYQLGGWVLHGNYGYAYLNLPIDRISQGFDLTSLGLPASLKSASQLPFFPRFNPAGFTSVGSPPAGGTTKMENHTWSGDASRLAGRHTLKIGGSFRLKRSSNVQLVAPSGQFMFNEAFTRETFNGTTGGNSIASLLLGLMAGGLIQQEPVLAFQVRYGAAYFQDDWRLTDRLLLNLGLRWDTDRPVTERFNRISWFDFDAALPIHPPGLPLLRGGMRFAERDGNPRGNKDPDNNNFAPRLGLAYHLTDRWAVRSGFGVLFNPTTAAPNPSIYFGALDFGAVTNVIPSIDGGRTPFTTLSNPFPTGFNQPSNGTKGLLTLLGDTIFAQVRSDRVPYSMQWNFNLQYELPNEMLLDLAYAGNAGVKLPALYQLNQLPDQFLSLGDELTRTVPNPFFGIIPATSSLGQRTTTAGQLLRPYPHLAVLTATLTSVAHSSYHSFQAKFRQRYRNGLQMLAAYTWSKTLDDFSSLTAQGYQNPGYTNNNKRSLDKSLSALDVVHHLVINYQYALPFGKGRRFLNSGGLWNVVYGGWSLNGITTLQSGLPISVSSQTNNTNSFGGVQRPDSTGKSSRTPGSVKGRPALDYLDPAAFSNPPRFTFGNVGRFLPDNRNPYLQVWDLSIQKDIPIQESRRLEFRAEFFNLFNHVNFAPLPDAATQFGRPGFGAITGSEPARIIQLGLKLYF